MSERRYTTAPESYDAGTTRTVQIAGRTAGQDLREVEIEDEDLAWQTERYWSGLHCCWSPAEYLNAARLGLVKAREVSK